MGDAKKRRFQQGLSAKECKALSRLRHLFPVSGELSTGRALSFGWKRSANPDVLWGDLDAGAQIHGARMHLPGREDAAG
jgi:hypothetical protein